MLAFENMHVLKRLLSLFTMCHHKSTTFQSYYKGSIDNFFWMQVLQLRDPLWFVFMILVSPLSSAASIIQAQEQQQQQKTLENLVLG
jgi:hypothetical protein